MDDEAQLQPGESVPFDDSEPRPLPLHTPGCFGCGTANSAGLGIQPYRVGDQIYADIAFDERHIGAPGLAHGGAIAAACDEILGFTLWIIGAPAVTRALSVDYLAPVALHQTHRMTATVEEERGRAIHVSVRGARGDDTAFSARGVYVRVPYEHFTAFGEIPTPVDELQRRLDRESGR